MAERSEAKNAKRSFASKIKIFSEIGSAIFSETEADN